MVSGQRFVLIFTARFYYIINYEVFSDNFKCSVIDRCGGLVLSSLQ